MSHHTIELSIEKALYTITSTIGVTPLWERELVKGDYQLQSYKRWIDSNRCCKRKCKELYYNRITYLKGWM